MDFVVIGSVVGVVVLFLIAIAVFMVLRSSTRADVLKGTLIFREVGTKDLRTRERYVRETVKMTMNVEVEADKKTLTIDAEGASEDVERITGVLSEMLAANVGDLKTSRPEILDDSNQVHSRFTVIQRSTNGVEPSLEAALEFVVEE